MSAENWRRTSSEAERKLLSSKASAAAAKAELTNTSPSPIDGNLRLSISSPPTPSPQLLQQVSSGADTSKISKLRMRRFSSELSSNRAGFRPSYLSFQSVGLLPRRESSGEKAQGSRELVELYETEKSPSLQQHGQYKHSKWGEGEFCEVDFDISDVNMNVSITDAIKIFPLTDSLAQCVKSYSAFLRRLAKGYNHEAKTKSLIEPPSLLRQPYSGSIELTAASPLSSSPDVLSPSHTPSSSGILSPSSPVALSPSRLHSADLNSSGVSPISRFLSNTSPGDLFMPKSVQDAFDFAWMVSRSATRAVDFCPRRRRDYDKPRSREDEANNNNCRSSSNTSVAADPPENNARERQQRRHRRRSRTDRKFKQPHYSSSSAEIGSGVQQQQSNPDECYNPDSSSGSSEDDRSSCGPSAAFRVCPRRRPKKASCVRASFFFGRF